MVTPDLANRGLHAGDIVKQVAAVTGGSGKVVAYGAVVDNLTGDATFVPYSAVQWGNVVEIWPIDGGDFEELTFEYTPEELGIDAKNADLINATHRKGGRVIAVGTTAMRVLETVASIDHVGWASAHAVDLVANAQRQHGLKLILQASEGTTSLFIRPGYEFKIADALITNFHLPRSTLLALVSAFAGLENTLAAYRHAIEQRYRFYSYGDAMLIA